MTIPNYQEFMLPVLRLVAEQERPVRQCAELAADSLSLTQEERELLIPSGRQRTLYNRVHWAVTYLVQAGLVERVRRGVVIATDRGRETLARHPNRIDNSVLSQFHEFLEFRQRGREGITQIRSTVTEESNVDSDPGTPEERIGAAAHEMGSAVRRELLAKISAADPTFFEHLILDLMSAMGYGGSGSVRHLGKTNDGGVDGLINEDPLGLDVVYLQAKRYAPGNVVGVDKVREFAGSLDERGAVKGVFVTTSHFAPQAQVYAERSPKRLILIDGEELTRLLVRYDVGVRSYQTVELKKIDLDYFAVEE